MEASICLISSLQGPAHGRPGSAMDASGSLARHTPSVLRVSAFEAVIVCSGELGKHGLAAQTRKYGAVVGR